MTAREIARAARRDVPSDETVVTRDTPALDIAAQLLDMLDGGDRLAHAAVSIAVASIRGPLVRLRPAGRRWAVCRAAAVVCSLADHRRERRDIGRAALAPGDGVATCRA